MSYSKLSRRVYTTIPTLLQQVQNIVPKCAQPCLAAYFSQEFNVEVTCLDGELSCVCAGYSLHGFTLGELALTCLHISDCGPENLGQPQKQSAYGICSDKRFAVRATNTVISPPAITSSLPRTTSTGARTTMQPPAPTSKSPTASSDLSLHLPSATSSNAADSTSPSPGSSELTSGQTIGVTIAAVGFLVLVTALAYILVCVRRKKLKTVDLNLRGDYTNDEPSHKSWFHFPASKDRHNEPASEKRRTVWPSPHVQPGNRQTREKATRTFMSRESLRRSSSNRTMSRLLPGKPLRLAQRAGRQSVEPLFAQTPATVFEEDRFSIVPQPIPSLPKNPRQPQYAHQFTRPSLAIPQTGAQHGTTEATRNVPPRNNKSGPLYQSSKSASSDNSFLNYHEGPDSGSLIYPHPCNPIDHHHMQIRTPAPAAITTMKPSYHPIAVRTSMASDASRRTSFESTDPDEATPPDEANEEHKRLTPVAESPIASIKYPKIPRGSNQVVPRSPPQQYTRGEQPQTPTVALSGRREASRPAMPDDRVTRTHTPTLSGSTLASKRLGDHAAHTLERGLRITNGTAPRAAGHQWGDGSNVNGNGSPANWPLPSQEPVKSPRWEPKLTPSRMGGDLYLSVSVATPKHGHFPR